MEKTKAAILTAVAVSSVIVINHFAGDYGIRMLYYRSFIAVPLAPGELVPQFGVPEYLRVFRTAISDTINGSFPFFVLMGIVGFFAWPVRVTRALGLVTGFYVCTHFILFPSGQERFWGPFYLRAAMMMTIGALHRRADARLQLSSPARSAA